MAEFITAQQVKDITPISGVTDGALIEPFIITAQDKYLRVFLGEDFYQQIKAAIPSPSTAQGVLINTYIRPYIAWYVYHEALLPGAKVRTYNGGLMTRTSADTAPIERRDYDSLKAQARETADRYAQIMKDYLDDNTSTFTLWKSCDTNTGQISSVIMIG